MRGIEALVRANYARAQERLQERRELLEFKRRSLETDGPIGPGEQAAKLEEIRHLAQEIEEDERFLPAFERRLQDLRLEKARAILARHPATLDRVAAEHGATWDAIIGLLYGTPGPEDMRGLLRRLAELEARHHTLLAEYRAARRVRAGDSSPSGPQRRLAAKGCPPQGSREQFAWLVSNSPASGHLRAARRPKGPEAGSQLAVGSQTCSGPETASSVRSTRRPGGVLPPVVGGPPGR